LLLQDNGGALANSQTFSIDMPKIFHVFSRIHGDIERDYNNFQIDTTYFSQGPGNFRDVNQNRRLDGFHSPEVRDFNIRMFLSFVQADGYNPLTVASTNFKVSSDKLDALLSSLQILEADPLMPKRSAEAVRSILLQPFRPGKFFQSVESAHVRFALSREEVLSLVIAAADQSFAGASYLHYCM
jgi:hypothetical protein